MPPDEVPRGECLKDVVERVLPYWREQIVPAIKAGKKVLIAAHGNSLRALIKHLEGLSEAEIEAVNLPTGAPKAYKLNERFLAQSHRFLGNQDEVLEKMRAVANQTKGH